MQPANLPPSVTSPGDQTSTEGDTVGLPISASDPENETLAYSASGLPTGLDIDPSTGVISGTIDLGTSDGSPYSVEVTAADGSGSGTADFTWTVNPKIAFRAASFGKQKGGTSITIPAPSGVQDGELLLAAIDVGSGSASISTPSGWTLVTSAPNGSGFEQYVFSKLANGEPSSYTWTFPSSFGASGVIVAYRGVDPGSPVAGFGGQANTRSKLITAPSLNGSAGGVLVGFFGIATNASVSPAGGMLERAESTVSGKKKLTIETSDDHLASSGATGARTATANRSAVNIGQVVLLQPAP